MTTCPSLSVAAAARLAAAHSAAVRALESSDPDAALSDGGGMTAATGVPCDDHLMGLIGMAGRAMAGAVLGPHGHASLLDGD
jgi:hypothetical protein